VWGGGGRVGGVRWGVGVWTCRAAGGGLGGGGVSGFWPGVGGGGGAGGGGGGLVNEMVALEVRGGGGVLYVGCETPPPTTERPAASMLRTMYLRDVRNWRTG